MQKRKFTVVTQLHENNNEVVGYKCFDTAGLHYKRMTNNKRI